MSNQKHVNCTKCKHYYITWDQLTPKGCKVYGVKSRQLPYIAISKETEEGCLSYEPKDDKLKKDDLDLNDDSLW